MKYRSNSILAYIPQNKAGELLLKQAMVFMKALGMRIFIMDLIKHISIFSPRPNSKRNQIRHQAALNKYTEFVKKTLQTEIPNDIILRIGWGKMVNALINESEHGGYEFVIIDKTDIDQGGFMLKNDINRYISKSFCPVLSINKNYPIEKVKKIIIPIDIAQRTKKRLYWATFFAKKFNARIQIVSALNVNIKATKSLAYKNAEKLRKMLEQRGLKCDVEILKLDGQVQHTALLQHIEKEKPDLVIIRTHQESRFSGKKIGTFVSEIVHGSSMPVFTVGGITQDYNFDLI